MCSSYSMNDSITVLKIGHFLDSVTCVLWFSFQSLSPQLSVLHSLWRFYIGHNIWRWGRSWPSDHAGYVGMHLI